MLALASVEAFAIANALRGNKDNKNTLAVIVTLDGNIVSATNGEGIYNSAVQEALDFNAISNVFNRQCAEVNAVSKALNQGYDLTCAVMVVISIGGINSSMHGLTKAPCPVCAGLLLYYAIIYIPV